MKKKIAFIANDMSIGGVEQSLVELSRVLDYEKVSCVLWLVNKNGPLRKRIDPRMEVRELYGVSSLWDLLRRGKLYTFIRGVYNRAFARKHRGSWRINQWYTSKCAAKISEKYDCVIAYHGTTSAVSASALYNINAKKRILWVHGDHRIVPEEVGHFQREYKKFDKIFCVSEAIRSQFTQQFPDTAEKTEVLYNAVNPEAIRIKADAPTEIPLRHPALVTVGRLAKEKGQNLIPETARLLLDNGYPVYWYLIGDGPMREAVEEAIVKYKVTQNVFLLGAKANPYPYMKNCDIYVQPSYTEGFCTTTVEAKILHKLVVTTDAPGMLEQFVSGENGIISKHNTPEALLREIQLLLESPELRNRIIDNLRHERYDYSSELLKLYHFIHSSS